MTATRAVRRNNSAKVGFFAIADNKIFCHATRFGLKRKFSMRHFALPLLFLLSFVIGGCYNYTRFLEQERTMLTRVSQSKLKSEQKLDSLLASSVRLMNTALKPINPVKGGKLVAKYFDQNDGAMEAIMQQANQEFNKMNLLDQGLFAASFATKPYAKQFIDLYPRFKKKYNQIKAAAKFIAFFGRTLGKLGKLGVLLGL